MARTPKLKPRRVQTRKDRERPSVFTHLKAGEQFRAYALFDPDPEKSDNPGFYEYFAHWDQEATRYVPCAGDQCPFCIANQAPSTLALTGWYFPDNKAGEKVKVFRMNYGTLQDFTDVMDEEEGVLGKHFRLKRKDESGGRKGDYVVRPTSVKMLTKKEIKEQLKVLPDLEELVENDLKRQWERLKAVDMMEDDEDDDTPDTDDEDEDKPSRKGKSKSKPKDEEPDEDDDDDDDDDEDEDEDEHEDIEGADFTLLKVSKKNNNVVVDGGEEEITLHGSDDVSVDEFKKGDEVTIDAEWDEDEEQYVISSIAEQGEEEDEDEDDEDEDDDDESEDDDDESEEEEDEDEDSDELEGHEITVAKTNEEEETIEGKDGDGEKFKLWLAQGLEVDFDEVKKGAKITFDAEKDEEGDWVATKIEVAKKGKGKGGKKK